MAVSLKIDTNIEFLSLFMEELHPGCSNRCLDLVMLLKIVSRGTICIIGLHQANTKVEIQSHMQVF